MAEAVAFSPADLHPLKNVQGAPHCVHFQISYHTMVLFSRKFSPYLYTLTGGKRVSASSEVDLLIYHFSGMQWRNITNQSCPPIMSSFFHFLYICLQVRIKGAYAEVISYNKKSLERELQMGKILEDMRNEAELNKAKWESRYHLVFAPTYRRQILHFYCGHGVYIIPVMVTECKTKFSPD